MNNEIQAPPGAVFAGIDVSPARLHGEACWHCGAVVKGLATVGNVYTRAAGQIRVWPVVACEADKARALEPADSSVDTWPAAPVPVPGCTECTQLDLARTLAVEDFNAARESQVRVDLRRHLRLDHRSTA